MPANEMFDYILWLLNILLSNQMDSYITESGDDVYWKMSFRMG